MKLFNKNYQKIKTKNFIKKSKLSFFLFNSYLNVNQWTLFKQQLKTKNSSFLISSKTRVDIVFCRSIFANFVALSSQILILVSFKSCFLLPKVILPPLPILAIKLNKHIYHKIQLKNNCSFHYNNNKLLLFKFIISYLKIKSK